MANLINSSQEIWKDVPNYEGFYEVSNLGNVRSTSREVISYNGTRTIKGKLIRKHLNRGYQNVAFSKEGRVTTQKVHRIVMAAFKGESDLLVNHIDSNKANNNLSNLEYCTNKENCIHAIEKGNYRRNIILDMNTGVFYDSTKELANLLGMGRELLNARLLGRRINKTSYKIV